MGIFNFVGSIMDRLFKSDLLTEIDLSIKEAETSLLPFLENSSSLLGNNDFKSKESLELIKTFYENYKTKMIKGNDIKLQKNIYRDLQQIMSRINTNLKFIRDNIDRSFNRDIVPRSVDYKRAIMLRSADHMTFLVRNITEFLNVITSYEIKEAQTKGSIKYNEEIMPPKRTVEQLKANLWMTARLCSLYSVDSVVFENYIKASPEVAITEAAEKLLGTSSEYGDNDYISNNVPMGWIGNPIFAVRMAFAQREIEKYKELKDKKRLLELKIVYLKSLMINEPSTDLENEIEFVQGKVNDIDYKLSKLED